MALSLTTGKKSTFHFVGIFGSGMSAIAQYLAWSGHTVTGSDRLLEHSSVQSVKDKLIKSGCTIFAQNGSGILESTDAVIVSTAIENTNPDIHSAQIKNIPVYHRSDILAAIVETKKSIAVAGTSGKSTVVALIFHLLQTNDKKPGLISGASLSTLQSDIAIGNAWFDKGEYLVIEADESDGTLVKYRPEISIFLNISKDHKPIDETLVLFDTLAKRSEISVINYDDEKLSPVQHDKSFALEKKSDCTPDRVEYCNDSSYLTYGKTVCRMPYPGKHNAANCAAAIRIALLCGITIEQCGQTLHTFKGIARRYDIYPARHEMRVIDDYAHNPEKIHACMTTAQAQSETIIALFQPHGFGPTKFMFQELVDTFSHILRPQDTLILLPIYYAGGTASKDICSADIKNAAIHARGSIEAADSREHALQLIAKYAVKKKTTVVSMGARDPTLPDFAKQIVDTLNTIDTISA